MKTGVVIVNYNCARYALDAAFSALGDDPDARVVIVDNASTDDSDAYFQAIVSCEKKHIPAHFRSPEPAPKFTALAGAQMQAMEAGDKVNFDARLIFLKASQNDGFAAGCNIGIKFLQDSFCPDMFLLLNPDALIAQGALEAFRHRLADDRAGLCGASVLRHEDPNCAQAFGGARLNRWTLLGDNIGAGLAMSEAPPDAEVVELNLSYPLGAAMAFRRDYIEIAGYLDERFFLYYEEADWARRGAPLRKPVWARDAVIYHRHGAAAGSRLEAGERSPRSDYHMARSRILYALKWRPLLTPVLIAGGVVQAVRRIFKGHWRQARAVLLGSLLVEVKISK